MTTAVETWTCAGCGEPFDPDEGFTSCPDLPGDFCDQRCHRDFHADQGSLCSLTDPRYDTETWKD